MTGQKTPHRAMISCLSISLSAIPYAIFHRFGYGALFNAVGLGSATMRRKNLPFNISQAKLFQ